MSLSPNDGQVPTATNAFISTVHSITGARLNLRTHFQMQGETMATMTTRVINCQNNLVLEEYVKQRIEMILGKFEDRIETIEVRFKEDARRKTFEKNCVIEVQLNPRGTVRISSRKSGRKAAALDAIRRAELQVSRDLKRHQRGQNLRHRQQGLRPETRQWAMDLAASI